MMKYYDIIIVINIIHPKKWWGSENIYNILLLYYMDFNLTKKKFSFQPRVRKSVSNSCR